MWAARGRSTKSAPAAMGGEPIFDQARMDGKGRADADPRFLSTPAPAAENGN